MYIIYTYMRTRPNRSKSTRKTRKMRSITNKYNQEKIVLTFL